MYTKEDYFEHTLGPYGWSESACDIRQQEDIDYLSSEFDKFLDSIGCRRTSNSEWYYNAQHSGIHAETICDTLYYEPRECRLDYVASNWRDYWNGRVGRMKALCEFIEKRTDHLNEAPYAWNWGWERRRDARYERERDIAQGVYEELVEDTLEEICDMYEKDLQDACEWCESDEAAQDWANAQNDIDAWQRRREAERAFEAMSGQTAQYERYVA